MVSVNMFFIIIYLIFNVRNYKHLSQKRHRRANMLVLQPLHGRNTILSFTKQLPELLIKASVRILYNCESLCYKTLENINLKPKICILVYI